MDVFVEIVTLNKFQKGSVCQMEAELAGCSSPDAAEDLQLLRLSGHSLPSVCHT